MTGGVTTYKINYGECSNALPLAFVFLRFDHSLHTAFHSCADIVSVNFIAAPTGVYMIDQQPVLEVGMNIKVFELYGDPPSVPTVCEVMDGGDLREINSLIVSVLPSLVCEIATSGTTLGQSRPYRIILSTSSSAIIGDVNLVITSNGCSSTASRLTPEFSLTCELLLCLSM